MGVGGTTPASAASTVPGSPAGPARPVPRAPPRSAQPPPPRAVPPAPPPASPPAPEDSETPLPAPATMLLSNSDPPPPPLPAAPPCQPRRLKPSQSLFRTMLKMPPNPRDPRSSLQSRRSRQQLSRQLRQPARFPPRAFRVVPGLPLQLGQRKRAPAAPSMDQARPDSWGQGQPACLLSRSAFSAGWGVFGQLLPLGGCHLCRPSCAPATRGRGRGHARKRSWLACCGEQTFLEPR
ncbi:uncharacterized protein LOC141727112 [Zonotrichia albicollis]|uniref:uncharacterized protein LOC141727112 n=1 Tax=Zonotrichia albicollis TaxID=44394 RepID=UPI003D80C08F